MHPPPLEMTMPARTATGSGGAGVGGGGGAAGAGTGGGVGLGTISVEQAESARARAIEANLTSAPPFSKRGSAPIRTGASRQRPYGGFRMRPSMTVDPESTFQLIERVRQGDTSALERLFDRHLEPLQRFARGRLPRWARDL